MADIRLVRPEAGTNQAVACEPEAKFVFDFPTDAATLSRNGDNLVMTFEDGATLTLTDFYKAYSSKNMPSFEVDGAQVAGADFFAAMNEPDLMPAAGPGGRGAAAGVGGARYHEYANMALYDGLDRLGGLDVGWPDGGYEPEIDGAAGRRGDEDYLLAGTPDGIPSITPTNPGEDPDVPHLPTDPEDSDNPGNTPGGPATPSTGRDVLTLHEKHLPQGTAPNAGSLTVQGSMHVESPDGVDRLEVGGHVVYENGQFKPTDIPTDEGTLHVTGFNPGTGELTYEYTLESSSQEHDEKTNKGAGDKFAHDIPVTVTDPDGDSASSTITVVVEDDAPEANDDEVTVREGGKVEGNVLDGHATVTDTEGRFSMTSPDTTGDADMFGADGHQGDKPTVQWKVPEEWGEPVEGTENTWHTPYGDITLYDDGSYDFTLDPKSEALQRLGSGKADLSVGYSITDADGDTDNATLTLHVQGKDHDVTITNDPDPEPGGGDGKVDNGVSHVTVYESGLEKGTEAGNKPTHEGNSFTVKAEDGLQDLKIEGESVWSDGEFTEKTITDEYGNELHITGVDDNGDGTYTVTYDYTLNKATDKHSAQGQDNLYSDFTVEATDLDGSTATGTITATVVDDTPTAINDSVTVKEGQTVKGDVLKGSAEVTVAESGRFSMQETRSTGDADVYGADGQGTFGKEEDGPKVQWNVEGYKTTEDGNGNIIVETDGLGTVTLHPDGTYEFAASEDGLLEYNEQYTLSFGYTITDKDGDTSDATLNITIEGNSTPDITPDAPTEEHNPDPYPEHKHDGAIGVKADSIVVDEAAWAAGEKPGDLELQNKDGHNEHGYKGHGGFNVDLHGEGGDITLIVDGKSVNLHVDANGNVTVTWKDGNGEVSAEDQNLTVNGVKVHGFDANVGEDGKVHVTYDYTLEKNLDHNNPDKVGADDALDDQIKVHVEDLHGQDSAEGYIDVQVHDDGPWVNVEMDMADPNTVLRGKLHMGFGADSLKYGSNSSSPALTVVVDGKSYSGSFTSDGKCVFDIEGEGQLVIDGRGLNTFDGNPLDFEFKPSDPGKTGSLEFTFVVQDGDGDTVTAKGTVKWNNTPDIIPEDPEDPNKPDTPDPEDPDVPGPDTPDPDDPEEEPNPPVNPDLGVKADSITVDEALLTSGTSAHADNGNGGFGDGHEPTGKGGFFVDLHGEGGDITLSVGGESVTLHVEDGTVTFTDKGGNSLTEAQIQGSSLTVNGVKVHNFKANVDGDGKVHVTYDYTLEGYQTHNDEGANTKVGAQDTLGGQITVHVKDTVGKNEAEGYIDVQVHDDGPTLSDIQITGGKNITPQGSETEAPQTPTYEVDDASGTITFTLGGAALGADQGKGATFTVIVNGKAYTWTMDENGEWEASSGNDGALRYEDGQFIYTPPSASDSEQQEGTEGSSQSDSYTFKVQITDSDGDSVSREVTVKTVGTPEFINPEEKTDPEDPSLGRRLDTAVTDDSYVERQTEADGTVTQPAGRWAGHNGTAEPGDQTSNNGKATSNTDSGHFGVTLNGDEYTITITGKGGEDLTLTLDKDGNLKAIGSEPMNNLPKEGITVHGLYGDLTITSVEGGEFGYTYTQKHNYAAHGSNAIDEVAEGAEHFTVTVEDKHDHTLTGHIDVNIDDDEPTVSGEIQFERDTAFSPDETQSQAAVYDDKVNGETVEHPNAHDGNVTLTGKVHDLNFGADGAQSVDIEIDGRTFHGELNTNGQWTWTENGGELPSGTTVTFTQDGDTGTFSVTLPAEDVEKFSHVDKDGNQVRDENEQPAEDHTIDFTVTVTDGDGDTATATGQLHPPVAADDSFDVDVKTHFNDTVEFGFFVNPNGDAIHQQVKDFGEFFTGADGEPLTKEQILQGDNVLHFDIDKYSDAGNLSEDLEKAAEEARKHGQILHVFSSSGRKDLEIDHNLNWGYDQKDTNLFVIVDCDMTVTTRNQDGKDAGGSFNLRGFLYVEGNLTVNGTDENKSFIEGGVFVAGEFTDNSETAKVQTTPKSGDFNVQLNGYQLSFDQLLKNDSDTDAENKENPLHIVDGSITLDPESAEDWDLHVDYENRTVTVTPKYNDNNPQSHPKFSYTVEDEHGLRDDASVSIEVHNFIEGHGGTPADPVLGTGVHDIVVANSDGNPETDYIPKSYNIGIVLDASSSMDAKVSGSVGGSLDVSKWDLGTEGEGNKTFEGPLDEAHFNEKDSKLAKAVREYVDNNLHVKVNEDEYFWDGEFHSDGRLEFFTKDENGNINKNGDKLTLYDTLADGKYENWTWRPSEKNHEHSGTVDVQISHGNGENTEELVHQQANWRDRTDVLKDAVENLLKQLAGYEGEINLYINQFNDNNGGKRENYIWGPDELTDQNLDEVITALVEAYETHSNTNYGEGLKDVWDKFFKDYYNDGAENHLYFLTDGKPEEESTGIDELADFKSDAIGDDAIHVHMVGIGDDVDEDDFDDYKELVDDVILVPDNGDLDAVLEQLTESIIDFIPSADVVDAGDGNDIIFGDAVGDLYAKLDFLVRETKLDPENLEKIPASEQNNLEKFKNKLSDEERQKWTEALDKAGGWNAVLAAQFIAAHPDWFDQSYENYFTKNENGPDTPHPYDKGDILLGGDGNDLVYGQGGNDILFGDGEREDIASLAQVLAPDEESSKYSAEGLVSDINDENWFLNSENDQTVVDTLSNLENRLTAMEQSPNIAGGDDLLFGGSGADLLIGGAGDDKLFGGEGSDALFGGSGNDYLNGGKGNDYLYGGSGNDLIVYGDDDIVFGGDGIDILLSNETDKTLDSLLDQNVHDVEVFLKGTGKDDDGNIFFAEDLTSLDELAQKAGIFVGKDEDGRDTLTFGDDWNVSKNEDGSYSASKDELTVDIQGMAPAATESTETDPHVFLLTNGGGM